MKREETLWLYLKRIKHIRKKMALATICSCINKLADLGPPILIGIVIDLVVSGENSFIASFGIASLRAQLIFISLLTILIYSIESLSDFASNVLWKNISQHLQHQLRTETYMNVQTQDMAYFEENKIGYLANIINSDISQLQIFLDSGLHQIIQFITNFMLVGIIFFLSIKSMVWLIVLPMPFIIIVSKKYQKIIEPKYSKVRDVSAKINAQLINNLDGISTIKSYSTEDYENKRIEELSNEYLESSKKAITANSAFIPIIRMIIAIGYTIILIISGSLVLSGQINAGVFATLMYMSERIFWPLVSAGQLFDSYQQAKVCVKRISQINASKPVIHDGDGLIDKTKLSSSISYNDVTFGYSSRKEVIKNINLKIMHGETVGIVGSTGSGKSTLLKLLLRFYDVTEGNILLNDVDIKKYRLKELRGSIAYISQDIYIFPGTIRENICYGCSYANSDDILKAAQMAEAHEFIMKLPNGYDTVIGEKGQSLSGGQRQRLSIARAILKNSPIIILDEATSALDNETEASIQLSIDRLCRKKTLIIIAHRLSTIRKADKIVVLDNGSIAEHGTHEELLEKNQIYAKQWRIQTGQVTEVDRIINEQEMSLKNHKMTVQA